MSLVVAQASTQYIKIQVVRDDSANPTGDTVAFQFLVDGTDPQAGNWLTGSWQTIADSLGNNQFYARCLIGPAGVVTLTPGWYWVWVKVTDNPEIPVQRVDMIQII